MIEEVEVTLTRNRAGFHFLQCLQDKEVRHSL